MMAILVIAFDKIRRKWHFQQMLKSTIIYPFTSLYS